MGFITFSECLGLDTRPMQYDNKEFNLNVANNLELQRSGSLGTRPAMVKVMNLDPNSAGLYKNGGVLRCIVPGGQSLVSPDPASIVYDPIGDSRYASNVYPLGKLGRVIGACQYGASVYGPYSYVAVQRSDTSQVEHHWIKCPQMGSKVASTRVGLPFQPGLSLLKLNNKIYAIDPANGYIRFCASQNAQADDWTTIGDAGFIAILNYANGANDLQGLTVFRNQLLVMFGEALLFYAVSANPATDGIQQQMFGPGTAWPQSATNFMGDTIFLSFGGFRTIRPMLVLSDEAKDDDIGARIISLTAGIQSSQRAIGLYCHDRGLYLCAVGTIVYCWYNYPIERREGWTTWTLPVAPDYLEELHGVIYARAGNTLYKFDDITDVDFTGQKVAWSWQSVEMCGDNPALMNDCTFVTVRQTAPAKVTLVVDGVQTMAKTIPGFAPKPVRTTAHGIGRQINLGASGSGAYKFEGGSVEYKAIAV